MACSIAVRWMLCVAVLAVLSVGSTALAVNNGVEPVCSDRRYDAVGLLLKVNNPTVPCSQNISGTCVLIDEWTILVARHSVIASSTSPLPAAGGRGFRVRFRRSESGDFRNSYFAPINIACHGAYTEVYVQEFYRPGNINMDVLMGRLETPVPWIVPIPAETDAALMPGTGQQVRIAGWGFAGPCFRTGNALTLRVATGVLPTQNPGSCCIYLNPCTAPVSTGECFNCPVGGPWVIPNFLDSGAPVLVERPCPGSPSGPGQLRVVGIISTTNSAWKTTEWNRNNSQPAIPASAGVECTNVVADFNADGGIDMLDLMAFLTQWFQAECGADVDQSGVIDMLDLFSFLTTYFAEL